MHPRALAFWDHPIPMNMVLFGNYRRLRDQVLRRISPGEKVIQLGSCYGDLMPEIRKKTDDLTIIDCVPEQLALARSKCDCNTVLSDAANTGLKSGEADVVVIFFLLHELPEEWKHGVLTEAYRLAGRDGRVIITEFASHKLWNPFGYIERLIFRLFEPFARKTLRWTWEKGAAQSHFGSLYRTIESRLTSAAAGAKGPVRECAIAASTAIREEEEIRERSSEETFAMPA